jgi:hypothetical protein
MTPLGWPGCRGNGLGGEGFVRKCRWRLVGLAGEEAVDGDVFVESGRNSELTPGFQG